MEFNFGSSEEPPEVDSTIVSAFVNWKSDRKRNVSFASTKVDTHHDIKISSNSTKGELNY